MGTLFLCLALGVGWMGCGGDGEDVTIDLALPCAQSLADFNNEDCMATAYDRVDWLKDCVMVCDAADEECLRRCLNDLESGLSSCIGDIQLLFSGACGDCPVDCAFDFVGDDLEPGCLMDPLRTGEQCLDDLYDCVNRC